ncbi:cupin domain-containing protein [Spirosoma sp. HMF4905]|uniref:Cupin domain-containing protein n=1 Tax=Spirosoma arboris TaxID=2682092 RepID=A0A7K1SJA0_9BACT|nr:cupin domain-containing protein [Spirosoma arboris]MVM33845.1 cupin domain-containing protein [Spirosoma arboris]
MTTPPRSGPLVGRTIVNPVLKEETIFLEISRESGGRHTLVDVLLAPEAGTPMHYHTDFSEEFTCLEGELSIKLNKKIIRLKRGESIIAPARSKHRFFNQSRAPCRFQCRFTPGFPGFEQTLQISYGLARDGKTTAQGTPKNPYVLGYLVLISETRMSGWLAFLQPLLNWLGRQALKNGVAAELQRRYLAVW